MSKMQPIKFYSVDDFLAFLTEDELRIVTFLRDIVYNCMPFCKEKLAYNVPYFYIHKRVLFIWPSSVPWGKVAKNGVMIGFCKGNLIPDEINYLDKGNRKEVFSKTFFSIDEIDIDVLKTYIFSAVEIDKEQN